MKLWLDDMRPCPKGWAWAKTAPQAIALLARGEVTVVSFDHDLGNDMEGTGYDVLCWMEEAIECEQWYGPLPEILIHSANPVGRARMYAVKDVIERMWSERSAS